MIEKLDDLVMLSATSKRGLLSRLSKFSERITQYLVDLHASGSFDSVFEVDMSQRRATNCFHASSTGYYLSCPRRAWYDLNLPSSEALPITNGETILNLDQGHAIHGLIQHLIESMYLSGNYGVQDFDKELPMWDDELRLSGHMDGFFYLDDPEHECIRLGLEIKTAKDNYWDEVKSKGVPLSSHLSQAATYCNHFRLPIMLFLYFNKNVSKPLTIPWVYDPSEWSKIKSLLTKIMSLSEAPEAISGWSCKDCKYRGACKGER